ncbi:acyl carrier protein [Streptomyces sp. NPDC051578]|uniref:acyl carrier protein n=1 Tax=unclassified Streptomyces TaxID=2593676 RepID=UPI0033CF100B
MTFEQVKEILTTKGGLPAAPITPEASLVSANIDSMALVVLSMQVEEGIGVEVSEDVLGKAASVAELAELVGRYAELRA